MSVEIRAICLGVAARSGDSRTGGTAPVSVTRGAMGTGKRVSSRIPSLGLYD